MKTLYGLLLLIYTGQFVHGASNNQTISQPNAEHQNICEICNCDVVQKIVDCENENLFKSFDMSDWMVLGTSNKSTALAYVNFEANGIELVTQFPKLDIKSMSFRHNKIRKIEQRAFWNLTLLEKLDLSENKLTIDTLAKEVFEGPYNTQQYEPMKSLKWLNLAGNDLHALNDDVFDHLPNLETLLLCHNQFTVIDPNSANAISSLNKLKVLDLSFMELKDLPDHMLHAPRELRVLNITGNLFTSIPGAIHFAKNLIELSMDDVPIEHIGGNHSCFPRLPKLETLSISYMSNLKSIEAGALANLPALRHFQACSNRHFSSIHPHAFANPDVELQSSIEWPPLQSLILYNNNLTTISEKLVEKWEELEEIDLRFNPWICACENNWIVTKLMPIMKEKSKDHPNMYEDIKCDHPYEMIGRSFFEISSKHESMRCEDYYGHRPERDGPILVGIFIGLMIGIPLTMAGLFIYRRGCMGIFGYRPNPADYGRAFYKRTELREGLHI